MRLGKIEAANRKFRKELKSGTVALVLLGVLESEGRPMYGYEISGHLEEFAGQSPGLKMGAIYPVLRSLESSGILTSRVEPSASAPPRKYYSLTGAGEKVYSDWKKTWVGTRDFVDRILKG
jgi:PadR family transcriptional regulator PadR